MSEHVYYKKPKKDWKRKKNFKIKSSASTNLLERENHNTQLFKNIF